jgi:hypothetical protein
MKKLVQFLLVSCVLIWSTGVFADAPRNSSNQSPESIVTCGSDKGDGLILIAYASAPLSIGMDLCTPFVDTCAPCITSLENQECKFIDVVVTHLVVPVALSSDVILGKAISNASYLLSCDGR